MSNQTKIDNLNYLIGLIFSKFNRLFVLSFVNEGDITSFSKYYTPTVEIKDYNVFIYGKNFFWCASEKEETYKKIVKISNNNDYRTGNILDYEYFSNNYKLIAKDLSKQVKLENDNILQQINFIGRLERNEGSTIFSITEKTEETTFNFSQNAVSIILNGNAKDFTIQWQLFRYLRKFMAV